MTKVAEDLRARIVEHLARSAPSTAPQIAFDLGADLGALKCGLKHLCEKRLVTRREIPGLAPVYTAGPKALKPKAIASPLTIVAKRPREPQVSRANYDVPTERRGEAVVERRRAGRTTREVGDVARARDFLCPDEIARGGRG